MTLTSKISEHNNQWSEMFIAEKIRIEKVFGSKVINIHHVGSTAVAELSAKPEIDLLVVVSDYGDEISIDIGMISLGYVRGKNLSEGHHFYRRNINDIRTHKVHVCLNGHEQIFRMLCFRDILRKSADLRKEYQNLKLELESTNKLGIKEYLAKKAPFINRIVDSELKKSE
ncbi:GrpB family protein [Pectobacterium brasiliense]|uniref:GrpB family protein n=1 Tax=Pectobacterium brasiliense TaxID=180957 RepID=UPI0015DF9539|nr:GrpB family protein [Pectobacterium brasiliense]MBA0219815.1 GrpB family protein [Pectobacterium brasiliense]MBN3074435.1 GrpB family protein [Pectobacterium brasiliense]MBN3171142.1 GrpB family protein [Pectobacterium brasiliense]